MRDYKLILLLFFTLLVGFSEALAQIQTPNKVERESKLHFEKVIKLLDKKPKWLYSEDICPFEVMPDFLSKVKNVSEGCLNNAEICLTECKKDDGLACYSLALWIQEEKGLLQDYSERLFLRSCKLGVVSGCTNRAAAIINSQETDEKAIKCAVDTFEKTCEKDDPWGCTMFGFALYLGKGRPQDLDKAVKVLSKSCKNGVEDPACQSANQLIEEIKKVRRKST